MLSDLKLSRKVETSSGASLSPGCRVTTRKLPGISSRNLTTQKRSNCVLVSFFLLPLKNTPFGFLCNHSSSERDSNIFPVSSYFDHFAPILFFIAVWVDVKIRQYFANLSLPSPSPGVVVFLDKVLEQAPRRSLHLQVGLWMTWNIFSIWNWNLLNRLW